MSDDDDALVFTESLIHLRQHISPKRLEAPGPTPEQLNHIFEAAAAAPDHGLLVPWRFVVIPPERRDALAQMFANALLERDATATDEQVADARAKSYRGAVLILCISDLSPRDPDTPAHERLVSLGCAIQNMMLTAQSMGFGAGLSSGRAMASLALRRGFALADAEIAVCFVSFGTVTKAKPRRERPEPARFVTVFGEG